MRGKIVLAWIGVCYAALLPAPLLAAGELIITQPVSGASIPAGTSFQITVKQKAGLPAFYFDNAITVIGNRGLIVSGIQTADPYIFTGTLPPTASGQYRLTAMGSTLSGVVAVSDEVLINASAQNSVSFVGLQLVANEIGIPFPGATGAEVVVFGSTGSGLPTRIPVESLIFQIQDPTIIDLKNGVPIGKKPGETKITVSYGGLTKTVSVSVEAVQTPGDFDGSGTVDLRDLEIVRKSLNTKAVSPYDARDLNKDGMIDALDLRILTNMCTKPRCAI